MFAIKCSSWTSINQGTSQRAFCSSIGFDQYESVSSANTMVERTLFRSRSEVSIAGSSCIGKSLLRNFCN